MSRVYNSKASASKAKTPVTKFCKVCFDLKKPKEEYESHYVRETPEPTAKVTCPTLLAFECTFCFKAGHTVGYCKDLARKKKEEERQKRLVLQSQKPIVKAETTKRPINSFAGLCDDSSDSETEQTKKQKKNKEAPLVLTASKPSKTPGKITKEDFPELTSTKVNTNKNVLSFSSIASQVYQENEQARLEKEEAELLARLSEITKQKEEQEKEKSKTSLKAVFLPTAKTHHVVAPKTIQAQELRPAPAPTRSLFDRSEYLDISDSEEETEIVNTYQYAKKCVEFNSDDFDEDW